ncbi:uncharacterized protein LOC143281288 [Babylonia areolata]|uniref:uncharacterized protein LOC143281288 n=1 Tax=Babylonia areolata TaxID=304850 RepID=UPI003FD68450
MDILQHYPFPDSTFSVFDRLPEQQKYLTRPPPPPLPPPPPPPPTVTSAITRQQEQHQQQPEERQWRQDEEAGGEVGMCQLVDLAHNFLLRRAVGYGLIVLSSLFVLIPMGVLQTKFGRECLLYSDVVYEYFRSPGGRPDSVLFRVRFGPQSMCQYTVAVSALFSLIFSLVVGAVYAVFFQRERASKEASAVLTGQGVMVAQGVVEVVVAVLMLVSACTVSHGFASLCGGVTDTGIAIFQVPRCSEAQRYNWRGFDASNFVVCLAVATAGCWLQFTLWSLQAALELREIWRLHILPSLPDWVKDPDSE